MGNTKRYGNKFDDDEFKSRKRPKHASNKRGHGMRVLNSIDEDEDDYEDPFADDLGATDEIFIQHIKTDTN